ncbi:hypothetical protein L9F63_002058, partial [Diploptera punctata]
FGGIPLSYRFIVVNFVIVVNVDIIVVNNSSVESPSVIVVNISSLSLLVRWNPPQLSLVRLVRWNPPQLSFYRFIVEILVRLVRYRCKLIVISSGIPLSYRCKCRLLSFCRFIVENIIIVLIKCMF